MSFLPQGFYIQQWQYGGGTAAEQNIDDAISLALEYKAAGIAEKVCDGLTWMGSIAAGNPFGVPDVVTHRNRCQAAGLVYIPWVNPLHGSRSFLVMQASLYALIGGEVGFLAWDTEPYAHFWGANRPRGDAAYMLDRFRADAPDCVNVWQPDPRPMRLEELRPDEWSQYMNVYAPQTYWGDFGTEPAPEITRALDQATNSFGTVLECAPTISTGGATPDEFAAALTTMADLDIEVVIAWRLGTLDAGYLSVLRDLAGHGEQPPAPPPPPPADDLATLKKQLEGMRILADDVAWERLGNNIAGMKITRDVLRESANALDANIADAEATWAEARRIRMEQLGQP